MTVQAKTFSVQLDASNNPKSLDLAGVAVGFTTTRWVVVNNLTPFTMILNGVGDNNQNQAALPPGTANKYPWANQYGDLTASWVNPIPGQLPPATPQVIVEYSDDPQGADLQGTYPTTLASGITIGTLTGPVSVTGSVAVSSVAGTVNISGGPISLAAGTAVQVSNNVTVTPSGTINVQGVAGGTAIGVAGAVTVTSGTVAVSSVSGTVTISGTVTASISSGTVNIGNVPTVNISAGQSVAVSNTVSTTVTNTVTITPSGTINVQGVVGGTTVGIAGSVTVSSGTVSISGTPSVTISSGSVAISSVSGTVTISGSVTVSSGTVSISGTPTVNIGTIPSITIASGTLNVGTVGSITANVNVNQAVQSIFNSSNTFTLGSTFSPAIPAITTPFECYRLTLQNSSLVQSQTLTVLVKNTTTGQNWQGTVQAVSQAATPPYSIIAIPVAANVGDTVTVKFTNVNNPGAVNLELVGLADGDTIMTAPGLPIAMYQEGGSIPVSHTFAGAGTFAILAAPPAGMAYRLHRLLTNTAAIMQLLGSTSSFLFGQTAGGATGQMADNLNGQLVTEGLTLNAAGASTGYLTYDLVAIPDIS